MPNRLQCINARLHHIAPLLAIQRRHHANATSIMLLRSVIGAGKQFLIAQPGSNKLRTRFHNFYLLNRTSFSEEKEAKRLLLLWAWGVGGITPMFQYKTF
jgi:hypothetical protein